MSADGQRLGNYQIVSRLGRGGMAEVFRARAVDGPYREWLVALKRLLPELAQDAEYVELFTREADLSLALHHPNVVRTLEVGNADGHTFLVMEYVDGRDLGAILRRCRQRRVPLPIDFGVFLAKTLLDALGYAHLLGLVHCDVSPSNLFVSRTGEIKLGDFGVARARVLPAVAGPGPGPRPVPVTGKPYYLSPEVLQGELSPAADLWAANVVLYELLTLERPFLGTNPDEVLGAVRQRAYRPVGEVRREIPPPLSEIVDRGFAARPEERFASAAEFSRTLAGHFDERIGTPLAIAAVVRGLFGAEE